MITRSDVLTIARSWVGTPYRHQASCKGVGADCLGLLRGIWSELYGQDPGRMPPYQPDWYDVDKDDQMLRKAEEMLIEIPNEKALPGHVHLFRMRPHHAAKHCGVRSEDGKMIHGLTGRAVEEVSMGNFFTPRIVATFSFPGVVD